ncbi:lipid-A-disaccharide synthase-related protein [Prochlorococcus sp. MIT 1341]|uniref:lipid-A-disaccharide synthase-related protein n=1 Tax=Prochlorococcus sp. MIT 1341 TaxID=3096221 RepID=UPI002A74A046|nr:lipid-A-disaccharide synthase-related protein [Prochlorococcus sp. MIT 1341]
MGNILLLSNGHGEDLSGALIGKALRSLGHQVEALPLVGAGTSYSKEKIKILYKGKEFSTGGLGYTSIKGRLKEIFQGQIIYLINRILRLMTISKKYDLLVIIGDIVPIFASWLTTRPVAAYIVAYSSHYEGQLNLPWPCKEFLQSKRFERIYTRDALTAEDLSKQLKRNVMFLGNPFMDALEKTNTRLPKCSFRIGLIPGSRFPEIEKNLLLMLSVVKILADEMLIHEEVSLDLALVNTLSDSNLHRLVNCLGWRVEKNINTQSTELIKGNCTVSVRRESFGQILHSSDLVLAMAGTATEQAIGLAKPVLQIIGEGPQFTFRFADAQRRLLGPTVFCANGKPGSTKTLEETAQMATSLLKRIKSDVNFQNECNLQAIHRIGKSGGSKRIAESISNYLLKPSR